MLLLTLFISAIKMPSLLFKKSLFSALKIHCSGPCQDNLLKLEGYDIEERGLVAMKGKGELLTYWVIGQDPLYKRTAPLEDMSDATEDLGALNKQNNIGKGTKTSDLSTSLPPTSPDGLSLNGLSRSSRQVSYTGSETYDSERMVITDRPTGSEKDGCFLLNASQQSNRQSPLADRVQRTEPEAYLVDGLDDESAPSDPLLPNIVDNPKIVNDSVGRHVGFQKNSVIRPGKERRLRQPGAR